MSQSWKPTNVFGSEFLDHGVPICESRNLASTPAPKIEPCLSAKTLACLSARNCCSTFQLETANVAVHSLLKNGAFLLADSTGIGKSRVTAAIMLELGHAAQRAIWISVNGRLRTEAQHELNVVGCDTQLFLPSELFSAPPHGKQKRRRNGHSTARKSGQQALFSSYSALLTAETFDSIVQWAGAADRCLIIFDEAHSCRNASATFRRAARLLDLPRSMVLFCTATVASHLKHFRYLGRLGIWGGQGSAFADMTSFVEKMRSGGTAVLELLAMQLKFEGKLVSRHLSHKDVKIQVRRVHLSPEERHFYDRSGEAFRSGEAALRNGMDRQAFFQKLITRAKVKVAINMAADAVASGMSVVISLQSTGESAMARGRDSCAEILARMAPPPDAAVSMADAPSSLAVEPIDAILSAFGPLAAEISGRKVPGLRLSEEREAFQRGDKKVAVITRAGSTGISLHDEDGRPRLHILLELPWSSEDFYQQAGRTHRTGQRSFPSYVILTTDVPAESRFVNCVAQRLTALSALSSGDRDAAPLSPVPEGEPNEWSAPARRLAALELWFRAAREAGDAPAPAEADAASASAAAAAAAAPLELQEAASGSWAGEERRPARRWSKARMEGTILRSIEVAEEREAQDLDVLSRPQLVSLIREWVPEHDAWEANMWSPATHSLFPSAVRKRAVAVLCCAARHECRHTLGSLPGPILERVLCFAADDPLCLNERAGAALAGLRGVGVSPWQFASFCSEAVQNRMLAMPLAEQQTVSRAMLAAADERVGEDRGVRDLQDFLSKPGIRFRIASIRKWSAVAEEDAVRIEVRGEAVLAEELFDTERGSVLKDRLTGRMVLLLPDGNAGGVRLVSSSGRKVRYSREQWAYLATGLRFEAGDDAQWALETRKAVAVQKGRATRASRSYTIVTENVLYAWPTSRKIVLRVPDEDVAHLGWEAFTGVLYV